MAIMPHVPMPHVTTGTTREGTGWLTVVEMVEAWVEVCGVQMDVDWRDYAWIVTRRLRGSGRQWPGGHLLQIIHQPSGNVITA